MQRFFIHYASGGRIMATTGFNNQPGARVSLVTGRDSTYHAAKQTLDVLAAASKRGLREVVSEAGAVMVRQQLGVAYKVVFVSGGFQAHPRLMIEKMEAI